jgi:hypothetical protein
MTNEEELRRAYEELDAAIQKVRFVINKDDSAVLGDWAIIAAEHRFADGLQDSTTYARLFRGGKVSYHIAIGLFQTAMELTQEGADDED